jgi:hypothetical protein
VASASYALQLFSAGQHARLRVPTPAIFARAISANHQVHVHAGRGWRGGGLDRVLVRARLSRPEYCSPGSARPVSLSRSLGWQPARPPGPRAGIFRAINNDRGGGGRVAIGRLLLLHLFNQRLLYPAPESYSPAANRRQPRGSPPFPVAGWAVAFVRGTTRARTRPALRG